MKLPTPNFYADVNARGGLELCSNRVRHFTSWLVAILPFHEFLRITHSLSNVCKGILHAFKYISQGLKEQLPIFVTFTLNFIKCYLFCLLDLGTNLHALSLMPVQMVFYQCTRELSPFTFGDSSEYPAFSESLGFTKTWRDTNGRNRLILTRHSMLQIDDWFCECIIWAQVKRWFALSTDQVRGKTLDRPATPKSIAKVHWECLAQAPNSHLQQNFNSFPREAGDTESEWTIFHSSIVWCFPRW